jgi:hypothetical protein
MLVQSLVDIVVLIDGEVGTNAGPVNPGVDPITRFTTAS